MIALGRRGQASTTRAISGSAGTGGVSSARAPGEVGAKLGTPRCCGSRNSLSSLRFTQSGLGPPEPKVTGSSPVGDTAHRTAVKPDAASSNRLRRLALRVPSLARVATSVGHGSRRSAGFVPGFRCRLRQIEARSGKQYDTLARTAAGQESTGGSTVGCTARLVLSAHYRPAPPTGRLVPLVCARLTPGDNQGVWERPTYRRAPGPYRGV